MNSFKLTEEAGITYRQLDYWKRRGFIDGPNPGSGNQCDWTRDEAEQVIMMARLVRAGLKPSKAARVCPGLLSGRREQLAPGFWIIHIPAAIPVEAASGQQPAHASQPEEFSQCNQGSHTAVVSQDHSASGSKPAVNV